ncbi:uncharacterized protein MYCFIDRAFT_177308 [Pseudocercospora fijiensis CIRAD86]|uniref:Uncharacterized protein n=1 Tax=Pseudocercospora fijiensis (strain CIRAD86) TaxID=383855 RepID=M2ZMN9_PSEFD|nr:uncharacterized protein MYCFIDRAFT_177308 [Pseudocercospora fijiensis CIRAD86]EME80359.1 hypothetical protein MYCFIDRAFT_177308 [Pseudocercospora fijiensis CIRAD86]
MSVTSDGPLVGSGAGLAAVRCGAVDDGMGWQAGGYAEDDMRLCVEGDYVCKCDRRLVMVGGGVGGRQASVVSWSWRGLERVTAARSRLCVGQGSNDVKAALFVVVGVIIRKTARQYEKSMRA